MADCKKCLHRIVCGKRPKMAGATIAECDFYEDSQPQTNADRFRAMSNEEQQKCVRRFWEIEEFADWLKQPAEVSDG